MKICQYDRVILKDGSEASIVEILEEGKVFIADIDRNGDTDNEIISIDDITDILNNEVNEYEAAEINSTMIVAGIL